MNHLYRRDVAGEAESTFDPGDEHTMSPPALPPYCSMRPHDNATNPYDAPTPASIGGTDSSYYPDNGRSGSVCLSPFLLQNSPTTSFYDAKHPEDQNTYDDESSNSKHHHTYETTTPDTMDTSGYVGYVGNATAVSPQMYGAAAAASSSSWQAGNNSWTPVTTASTAAQPFMSPQLNPYGGPGSGGAESYYEVDPQYDTAISVATISPGNEYPDPMSPSTAMSAESNRKKKRSQRRSSGSGGGRPVLTMDGLHQQQHRTTQLRTAQRSSKYSNSSHKPAETAEERKARAMHNQVEQQYRKRLNAQFERLLAALPPEDSSSEASAVAAPGGHVVDGEDRRVSKAEVLDRARQRIRMLEKERASLERQKRELVGSVGRLRDEWSRRMGGTGVDGN